jgi:hypothetical protein
MQFPNYLQSENRRHLADPPDWWLKKLLDTDAELVVFASRVRPAYVLARRRHFSSAMVEATQMDKNLLRMSAGMDGDILADHNLIYVRHLLGDSVRRFELFQWLKDHDVWEAGGGEAMASRVEGAENLEQERKRKTLLDNLDHRARDAYRSYQARTGRRAGFAPTSRGRATQMPVPGFSGSTAPPAAFVRD